MADPTPEQLQAQDKMREWMERYRQTPSIPGPFGPLFEAGRTLQNLIAAAGAGHFTLTPDTGAAIIKQLSEVQRQTGVMKRLAMQAAADPRFGGGYAEQVSKFVQQVAAGATGSAEEVLDKFWKELDLLKVAVARSTGDYQALEETNAGRMSGVEGTS